MAHTPPGFGVFDFAGETALATAETEIVKVYEFRFRSGGLRALHGALHNFRSVPVFAWTSIDCHNSHGGIPFLFFELDGGQIAEFQQNIHPDAAEIKPGITDFHIRSVFSELKKSLSPRVDGDETACSE